VSKPRDRLFIWALYEEALRELERSGNGHGLSAEIESLWTRMSTSSVRFLVGLIVTVGDWSC
jgi:hypothetical protein